MKSMLVPWRDCNRACAIWVCLLIAACQPMPLKPAGDATEHTPIQQTANSVAGKIILAEALLSENQAEAALSLYLEAASQSQQPDVAQRAAFLARQVGSATDSQQALDRWLALAPNALSAHEASLIAAAEQARFAAVEHALIEIFRLEPDYSAQWFGSFWAALSVDIQPSFAAILTRIAAQQTNGSLAIVVAEIKNRQTPESGTEWIDVWIERHGHTAEVALYRAQLWLPDRERAITQLAPFAESSNDPAALSQLARWVGSEGDANRAQDLLERAITKDPSRHQDTLTLALLNMQAGDLEVAEARLKALLAHERFRANAYYHLGEIALDTGEHTLAIDRFLRVDQGELVIEARKQLASLAVLTENPSQAHRWFAEARLLFEPFKQQLLLAEAQFQTARGEAKEAIPILTEALLQAPNDRQILYTRALAFESVNDIAGAEADLRAILAQDPEDPDALNALGYTLADRTDRFSEAEILIAKALEKKPDSAAILDSMGWVLFKLGQLEAALGYLEKAWALVQDHEIAAHYGEVLWMLGRRQEAQLIWQEGYASTPESDKIRDTIQRLTDT